MMRRKQQGGFTLLEAVIGIAILTGGILMVMLFYPSQLESEQMAELRTIGAALAMMKIEEVRRDNDENNKLIFGIENLPGPTDAIPFALEPRLAYRFSSTTLIHEHRNPAGVVIDDPRDPRDNRGVARVIIQISPKYMPNKQTIIDEYPFN